MRSLVKNTPPIPGATYRFLTDEEPLLPTDLVRATTYTNPSDYVDFDDIRSMHWSKAEDKLGGWIGKSLAEFYDFVGGRDRWPHEAMRRVV